MPSPMPASQSVNAALSAAEREKYSHAAQAWHASFSPFVVSVDGLLAREAWFTVQHFADWLSTNGANYTAK